MLFTLEVIWYVIYTKWFDMLFTLSDLICYLHSVIWYVVYIKWFDVIYTQWIDSVTAVEIRRPP